MRIFRLFTLPWYATLFLIFLHLAIFFIVLMEGKFDIFFGDSWGLLTFIGLSAPFITIFETRLNEFNIIPLFTGALGVLSILMFLWGGWRSAIMFSMRKVHWGVNMGIIMFTLFQLATAWILKSGILILFD